MSGCGDWVYGYRLHCLVSACSEAALPFDIEVKPANLKDYQVFKDKLANHLPQASQVLLADSGFDDEAVSSVLGDDETQKYYDTFGSNVPDTVAKLNSQPTKARCTGLSPRS